MSKIKNTLIDKHLKRKTERIIQLLEKEYGIPKRSEKQEDPLEELVRTILSQNTNDTNRDRALKSLNENFASWEDVANADHDAVAQAIRIGGLAEQKAKRIQSALRWTYDKFGEYSLRALKNLPANEVYEMLRKLDGVGPKTAAIVMLFSLGKPYFPVDTHIHRVTTRLGLLPDKTDAQKAHEILAELVRKDKYYSAHLNLITHGRRVCSARKPACGKCVLVNLCLSAKNFCAGNKSFLERCETPFFQKRGSTK